MIKANKIMPPKSTKVAYGRTVKNPEKKVVTKKPIFITHIFLSCFGHFRFKPRCLPVFTSNNLPRWNQSENKGKGQTIHHIRHKNNTRISISITHQSIQTIIPPKL